MISKKYHDTLRDFELRVPIHTDFIKKIFKIIILIIVGVVRLDSLRNLIFFFKHTYKKESVSCHFKKGLLINSSAGEFKFVFTVTEAEMN